MSATALLVLERTARFPRESGRRAHRRRAGHFHCGLQSLCASKTAKGQRVTQRGIRQVQSYLLRQQWNAGASAHEAALAHAMRSMDWWSCGCQIALSARRSAHSWAYQMWRRVLVVVATKSSRGRTPGSMFLAAVAKSLTVPTTTTNTSFKESCRARGVFFFCLFHSMYTI